MLSVVRWANFRLLSGQCGYINRIWHRNSGNELRFLTKIPRLYVMCV